MMKKQFLPLFYFLPSALSLLSVPFPPFSSKACKALQPPHTPHVGSVIGNDLSSCACHSFGTAPVAPSVSFPPL